MIETVCENIQFLSVYARTAELYIQLDYVGGRKLYILEKTLKTKYGNKERN